MTNVVVAISTTGDPHRLPFLARTVKGWCENTPDDLGVFVTVDGDEDACKRVFNTVSHWTESIYRVGQPLPVILGQRVHQIREGRLGVAVNKNTGLELMMHNTHAEHMFLSDDDIFPLNARALELHTDTPLLHSMVCWGYHRLAWNNNPWAEWTWPRGSMLYVNRPVVGFVGGMVEMFGPGGHEHVEWSRRISQAGFSPAPYISPNAYAHESNRTGQAAMGAENFWDAVDMPRDGEHIGNYNKRKQEITSVRREPEDWPLIEEIMRRRDGDTRFEPYTASENHRASATLYPSDRA